jgi:hypothetical protein
MIDDVVFLVGMPRSGTKLLRELLNRHKDIAIFPNESVVFPYFHKIFFSFNDVNERENFNRFFQEFSKTTFFRRISSNSIVITCDAWFLALKGNSYKDVIDALFENYRSLTGAKFVGDKSPSYITQIPLLAELYPNAKYIHIYRDPRDYALSIEAAWGKNKFRAVQRWKEQVRKFLSDVKLFNLNYCNVSYESLISNPEQVIRNISDFIGVDFQELMLTLDRPSENLGDTKGELSIVAKNSNKWVDRLSSSELKEIEGIAGEAMEELGYKVQSESGNNNVSSFQMLLFRLLDGLNLFKHHIKAEGGLMRAIKQAWRAKKHSAFEESNS